MSSSDIITVSLSGSMQAFVHTQVISGGYRDASEYVTSLIEEAQRQAAEQQLESLLLEGINSGPATEMTAEDWTELRAMLPPKPVSGDKQ